MTENCKVDDCHRRELEREIERLRAVFEHIASAVGTGVGGDAVAQFARKALNAEQRAHDPRDDFSPENDPFRNEQVGDDK